ncbi:histidine--tRNA ligase [Anabaena sp. UHCC 0253]|uniref:histidine--tRNA ligase n=1 Tax=Anabaena sp. UHCC 0253 TaxID=2590019 RepID=UPI001445E3C3|nr:histidine--tRNA ligase [Anabaena sp. UHCC 0253]MTJ55936.1 histidine--tRNA ligase [Anabaena sp. UHCC 0253]
MSEKINYQLPSGFIELLPGEKRLELVLIEKISQVFERYGFTPIETPAVERLEVLQAKGNQGDNIIYSISPILPSLDSSNTDEDESEIANRALKFDQTVPLAAYIARHFSELSFPFARYQMDMVFRGERSKNGRYRQFRQCDIDIVGRGELDLLYDAQIPAIIAEIFTAINIGKFLIRINNRKVLTGFFQAIGIDENQIKCCIKIVDNLEKIGESQVKKSLLSEGLSESQSSQILNFTSIKGTVEEVFTQLDAQCSQLGNPEQFLEGITELKTVIKGVKSLGVPENQYCLDLSIARGLNYYTGTVYETTLIGYESLGSICSGGRYEELVSMFVGEKMPGVGISIGFTRLMRRLLDVDILQPLSISPAQVMVANLQSDLIDVYLQISQSLRQSGLNVWTELGNRKLGKQLQQADKLGIPLCVIIGADELKNQECILKVLKTGEQKKVPFENLAQQIQNQLSLV